MLSVLLRQRDTCAARTDQLELADTALIAELALVVTGAAHGPLRVRCGTWRRFTSGLRCDGLSCERLLLQKVDISLMVEPHFALVAQLLVLQERVHVVFVLLALLTVVEGICTTVFGVT